MVEAVDAQGGHIDLARGPAVSPSTACSSARRLGRPVSSSCSAWWVILRSRSRISVAMVLKLSARRPSLVVAGRSPRARPRPRCRRRAASSRAEIGRVKRRASSQLPQHHHRQAAKSQQAHDDQQRSVGRQRPRQRIAQDKDSPAAGLQGGQGLHQGDRPPAGQGQDPRAARGLQGLVDERPHRRGPGSPSVRGLVQGPPATRCSTTASRGMADRRLQRLHLLLVQAHGEHHPADQRRATGPAR